jgi:putative PIN family toxin of toxin-antitoxin system
LETWTELRIVLKRPKLARYIQSGLLDPFLRNVWSVAEPITIPSPIRACRDPKDDKFLEVAVHGRADLIVTGDRDLLDLHPFRGIAILTPAAYLELD